MTPSLILRTVLVAGLTLAGSLAAQPSPTLASAIAGRRVVDEMVAALGGRAALRSIKTIATDETIRRKDGGQGLKPGAPSVNDGWRAVRFDVAGQRINEMRLFNLSATDTRDNQRLITPSSVTVFSWASMTKDSLPAAAIPAQRAAFGRRHLLPFLMSLERRPEAARLLGKASVAGNTQDVLAVTDADGVQFTLLVDQKTHLPTRIEQLVPGSALGDTVDVTSFSDYRRVGALLLPHRRSELYAPRAEWEYRVQRYELDAPIADSTFAISANLAPAVAPLPLRMTKLAPDVYLTPQGYESVFVVFDDHVVVLEGGGSTAQTRATVTRIREVAPGKPIRYVVATHFHDDHLAGLRTFIAEGSTIVTTADAKGRIEALARSHSTLIPDSLDLAPRAPVIEVVDKERVFKDAHHEVRIYQIGPTEHVDQMLIAHLPAERILFEADLLDFQNAQPAAGNHDAGDLARKVRELGLTFDQIVPVHGNPGPAALLEEAVRRGAARAKCLPGSSRRVPCIPDGH